MSVTPETPQSRIEKWLAVLAGVEGITPEEPQSRVEKWLAYIAENGGGGSGGTTDHTELSNRDAAGQHPMSAIEGLVSALSSLENGITTTAETSVTLTHRSTTVITGAPTALTVSLSAPVSGKDYLTGLIFKAGESFTLTETAPEGYSIVWSDTPGWTAGNVYEVIYRCLWIADGNGKVMISAKFSEVTVPQPEVSE